MNKKIFTNALLILLAVTISVPSAFFIAPQRTSAAATGCIGGILGALGGVAGAVTAVPVNSTAANTINSSTAGSVWGTCFQQLVLIPAAKMAIKLAISHMTESIVNMINGKTTGRPSFVQDLGMNLRGLGTVVALSFIGQITNAALNSPFGSAIAIALNAQYLTETGLRGFLQNNISTLSLYSRDQLRFLRGDWSQGGAGAWFALTTRDNNNPYILYQAAKSQLDSLVGQAQINRRQDLAQSGGFLSFCGTVDNAATGALGSACTTGADCSGALVCINSVCSNDNLTGSSATAPSSTGIAPGDACTNKDGTPGQVKTPGSIVHDATQKAVVDAGFDQQYADLISAADVDAALGAVVTAVFAKVLNGASGLLDPSLANQGYKPSTSNLNAVLTTAQTKLIQLQTYMTAWDTIHASADAASTSVQDLIQFCTNQLATASSTDAIATSTIQAQIDDANAVFNKAITPVFKNAQSVLTIATTTSALAHKLQFGTAKSGDITALDSAPPSTSDIQSAQSDAQANCGATASSTDPLRVTGGSLVDKLNLVSANATAIKNASCTVPAGGIPNQCVPGVIPVTTNTTGSSSDPTDPTEKDYHSWDSDYWMDSFGNMSNTDPTQNPFINISKNPSVNFAPEIFDW